MTREEFEDMRLAVDTYAELQVALVAHETMLEDFKKAGSLTFSSAHVKTQKLSNQLYTQILACMEVEIDRIKAEMAAL